MHSLNTIASWIPSKVRGVIYTLIGLFWLVDEIWNIIPEGETGEKIALSISLVAAIMAAVNTDLVPDPGPKREPRFGDEDAGESTLMTIVLVLVIVAIAFFLFGMYR
jgi:hypothetical protein